MKRVFAFVLVALALSFSACGGGGSSTAATTPAPTLVAHPQSGLLKPAGKARDTVNQLNQQQNQEEQQTGGAYTTP